MTNQLQTEKPRSAERKGDAQTRSGIDEPAPELNVLFVIDQLIEMGGAELALLRLVRGLTWRGLSPVILTFRPLSPAALLAEWPCTVHVLPMRRVIGFAAWRVAWQIRAYILRNRVNVVHTFFETSDLFAGSVARTVPGVALVTSRRDMGILRNAKHRLLYRRFAGMADRVVTVSNSVRQWCICEDHLPPENVVTIYNGVEGDRYQSANGPDMRKQLGLQPHQIVITAVGHLRQVKGFDVLIQAARSLVKNSPTAVVLIAGDEHEPGLRAELEHRIRFNNLEKNVLLLSSCDDVPSLLAASDIFVLPSRSEGFSNSLIEAMTAALPCVATDVGGNAEALIAGKTGFLVASEASDAMADALTLLVQSAELRERMGRAGRERALQQFTHQAMVDGMLSVYRDARVERERRSDVH